MSTVARFLKDQAGVTSIEYVFLATLVGLAIIVGATALGTKLNTAIGSIADMVPEV
jgi:pilus assembly protein Flp/PilA